MDGIANSGKSGDRDGRVARKERQKTVRVGDINVQRINDKFSCPICDSSYTDAYRLQKHHTSYDHSSPPRPRLCAFPHSTHPKRPYYANYDLR
ncbi:hypothetical protein HYPSUDRAFT_207129 [Hypholoma sublateritium FD-334 SS-4]|uniref:C2H2-type domain-containing protein n=1 Tax=Hypholoma sublateritium (strain FD-334 SS-4) TaxID=945553 RepID=A0A0D2LZK1_HYPSF|nr:hypothetical protein HYPSUDRAFT_207129 [Hypholoma sublateritium FD-334 SS-4]